MKFSIITVTKNAEADIGKTIKSVISQIDVDLEHVIIDSVSTDSTLDIVRKYQEKFKLLVKSEPDDGISDAFNKGLELCSGSWVIFLGAGDCFTHCNVLFDIKKELNKKPNALIVWGNIIFINSDGKIGKSVSGKFPKDRLKRYMAMPHQATFFKKDLFKKFGMFDKNIKCGMDYDLLMRCFSVIDEYNYIDYNVSYMLTGGVSDSGSEAIKDFRDIQIKHKVWPFYIAYLWYYWAQIKNIVKYILKYKSTGV